MEAFNSGIDTTRGRVSPIRRVKTSPSTLQYTELRSSLIAINPFLYEYLQNKMEFIYTGKTTVNAGTTELERTCRDKILLSGLLLSGKNGLYGAVFWSARDALLKTTFCYPVG